MLRQKWIIQTLESQLYEPKVLCIGGPSSSLPVQVLEGLWVLLGWCQDWCAVRPGGSRTEVFFSGFCFGCFRSLSRNRGFQSPLPLTQLASLNPLEKIPPSVVGLNQTGKKIWGIQSALWLVLWLLFGLSLISHNLHPFHGKE